MPTETAPVTDQQIIQAYQEYRESLRKRDEYTEAHQAWDQSLDRMYPAKALIWQLFGIGQPMLKDNAWTGDGVVDLLRRRSGRYPLTDLQVDYDNRGDHKFRYGFTFVVKGEAFEVGYHADQVSLQLTYGSRPFIDVFEDKVHALYLPKGLRVPVERLVVEQPRIGTVLRHNLWQPRVKNRPRMFCADDLPSRIRWFNSPEEAIQAKVRTRVA